MAPIFFLFLLIIDSALAKNAQNSAYWEKLLHLSHGQPLIKNASFLATYEAGKNFSAQQELDHWDRVFEQEEKNNTPLSERSFCRFPARYWWWSEGKLRDPLKHCLKFSSFYTEFNISKVYLIFSSYYAQNSASLFGHTFLRFARNLGHDQELLDWGVSYAAENQNINVISSFYKAFLGTFDGALQIMPYYYKVREYNDFEFRPLWSYELNLKQDDIKNLIFHLWELTGFPIKYQYLTHNCSSLILDTIGLLKPEIEFRDQLPFYHVPIDTVKVLKKNGLLKNEISYRASLMEVWTKRFESLDREEKKKFLKFTDNLDITQLENTKLLDAGLDYLDYKYSKELVSEDKKYVHLQSIKNAILVERSKKENTHYDAIKPQQVSPEHLHATRRIGVSTSKDDNSQEKIIFTLRPAYHDEKDNPEGITSKMKINFLQTELSYIEENNSLKLEKLEIIDIASWSYSPPLNHSLSYEFKIDWERWVEKQANSHDAYLEGESVQLAFGYTFDLLPNWYLTTMLDGESTLASKRENEFSQKVGPEIHLHWDRENYRFRLTGKKLYEVTGYQPYNEIRNSLEVMVSFNVFQDQIIVFKHQFVENYNLSTLSWYKYF